MRPYSQNSYIGSPPRRSAAVTAIPANAIEGALAFGAIVLGFLMSFRPPTLSAIHVGLDPSWRLALNEIATGTHRFGSDLAFTYGPLGVLLHPIAGFGFEDASLGFALIVQLGVWAFAIEAWRRWGNTSGLIIFAALFVIARGLGFGFGHWVAYEGELLLLQLLAGISVALEVKPLLRRVKTAAFAVSIAPMTLIKFTLAFSGVAILAVALLVGWLQRRPGALRDTVVAAGIALASMVATAALTFTSWTDAVVWFRGAWEIASGYSEAMAIPGSRLELLAGVLLLCAFAGFWLAGWRWRWQAVTTGAVASPAVVLAFKQGFVRQDIHTFVYFPFLIVLAGALSVYERRRAALLTLAMFGSVAIAAWVVDLDHTGYRYSVVRWVWQTVSAEPARDALHWALSPDFRNKTLARLAEKSNKAIADSRIPDEWRNLIGQQRTCVVPWDLILCRANALNCVYPRTVQTYSAYTRYLDAWTSEAFRVAKRPEFVLASFKEIDGRHPWYGAPATWSAILSGYVLARADVQRNLFLLRTRNHPLPIPANRKELTRDAQGWYSLIDVNRALVAISMAPTMGGRLRRLLFRNEPVRVEIEFTKGSRKRYRFIPSTAISGLMMASLPTSPSQMVDALTGRAIYPVTRFRIIGSGLPEYRISSVALVRE